MNEYFEVVARRWAALPTPVRRALQLLLWALGVVVAVELLFGRQRYAHPLGIPFPNGVSLGILVNGAIQGMLAACIVFPIAAVVHARSIHINLSVHWAVLVTLVPLACVACSALGLTFGTIFDPRNVPLMFGIIILPLTFLGGTYYAWTTLSPVTLWGVHWLQILVLVNPLVYINEGSRAALTTSRHMSLWAVYPALIAFTAFFLWLGTANFRRRVIS